MKSAVEQEGLDTFRAVKRGESRLSLTIARKVMKQAVLATMCASTAIVTAVAFAPHFPANAA